MNKERIIKESKEIRFPIKKELDLKKEVTDALDNLNGIVPELTFIIKRLEDINTCYKIIHEKDLKSLNDYVTRIAFCKIILEKIENKLKEKK